MGKALEWLTEQERETAALEILEGVDGRGTRGGEIWAHCPFHKEDTPGGAFSYNPGKDVGSCRSCSQNGDLVAIFNALSGRSATDGEGVKAFIDRYCPEVRGRDMGPRREVAPRARVERRWEYRAVGDVPKKWGRHALKFVEGCQRELAKDGRVQEQLLAWGLPLDACEVCRIGWNPEQTFRPVTGWGLPYATGKHGKEARIWLPKGLVFPMIEDGRVVRLKIRLAEPRPPDGTFQGGPRWQQVRGGATGYFIYGRVARVWVVVETERDAAAVWWALRGTGVGAMATGSASARPDKRAGILLRQADIILNALDFDKAGAENTYRFWVDWFPHQRRWPVPKQFGKDVGEAVGKGFNLKAWVWAGLPAVVRRKFNGIVLRAGQLEWSALAQWGESADVQAIGNLDQYAAWQNVVDALRREPGLGLLVGQGVPVEVVGAEVMDGAIRYVRSALSGAGPYVQWGTAI